MMKAMAVSTDSKPIRASLVNWDFFGDDIVIYHPMSKQYYVLNGGAVRMWQLADGKNTTKRIAEVLTSEYDISTDEALSDVADTLEGLSEFGLVYFAEGK